MVEAKAPRTGYVGVGPHTAKDRLPQIHRYVVLAACTARCKCNSSRFPGELAALVHSWFEADYGDRQIHELSLRIGYPISVGGMNRHKSNHLVRMDPEAEESGLRSPSTDHVTVLERIIAKGAEGLAAAKITPELTLKAMDMHWRLTQGKAIDVTMQAIMAAMGETGMPDLEPIEDNPDAVMGPDEAESMIPGLG